MFPVRSGKTNQCFKNNKATVINLPLSTDFKLKLTKSFILDNRPLSFGRGVNRLTDQRILTVFSPGFRIQSKILTDLRILQLQRFAVFIDFRARSLDFACDKVRIVDLSDRQKCLVLFVFVCVCVAVVFFFIFFLFFVRTRLTECHAVAEGK